VKSIEVDPGAAAALESGRLAVVVDRLDRRFDLIVVTNSSRICRIPTCCWR